MYMYMLKTSIQRSFLQKEQCQFLFETYSFLHITCNQFIKFIPFLSVYQLYSILTSTLTFNRHHLKSLITTDVKERFLCTGHIIMINSITNRLLTKWCRITITAKTMYIYTPINRAIWLYYHTRINQKLIGQAQRHRKQNLLQNARHRYLSNLQNNMAGYMERDGQREVIARTKPVVNLQQR